jgi:hypothetical protein
MLFPDILSCKDPLKLIAENGNEYFAWVGYDNGDVISVRFNGCVYEFDRNGIYTGYTRYGILGNCAIRPLQGDEWVTWEGLTTVAKIMDQLNRLKQLPFEDYDPQIVDVLRDVLASLERIGR